ncbi:MAG TPA: hypothetical protein PLW31_03205 [Bacteroidales bacterium]|nr:hypothetical protein [Bacteroidales bacterium]HPI86540.1 hypothetical protein [Bacteroidales bacterium]HPM92056.1 hypothetical protein [Bacteroidales bacterium]
MDAVTLTWTGITSLLVSSGVTYFLHFKIVKHIGSELTKLMTIFHQNEEVLKKIELQNDKAVKALELQNTKVITKWEYENERLLKKIDRGIEVKERSQVVAELFTLWMQTADGPSHRDLSPDEFAKMNRYSFECALWLPQEIFHELSKTLENAEGHLHYKEILRQIRMYLNPELGDIDAGRIIQW